MAADRLAWDYAPSRAAGSRWITLTGVRLVSNQRRRRIRWVWFAPAVAYAIAIWREDGWIGLVIGLALAVAFTAVAVRRGSGRQRE